MFNLIFSLIAAVAVQAANSPSAGSAAPDFSGHGSDGKTYNLSQFKGKTVVLEWFNKDCPYVRKFYESKTMQGLQKENTGKGIVWLTIASSAKGKEGFLDNKAAVEIRREAGMANTALLIDSESKIAKLYGAKTTP